MRWAFADPPYPGMAHLYSEHPDFAGEVDHRALLIELSAPGVYDGWALSTSAAALQDVLSLCSDLGIDVDVAAWTKGARGHANPHGPVSSWEPVIYHGGRHGSFRADSLVHGVKPRSTDPDRVIGAKPAAFARWLFELLGAAPGDRLDDLYPGSGGIARAWEIYASIDVVDDTSAAAVGDASARTSRDASPPGPGDGSPPLDASTTAGVDVSTMATGDASLSAESDALCLDGDVSPVDERDTSTVQRRSA